MRWNVVNAKGKMASKVDSVALQSSDTVTRFTKQFSEKCDGLLQPEYKKLCVDPELTSFEILRSLLARAFSIKGDFSISYLAKDDYGQETYLSLLSDWDLDAAFLSASDPCLRLKVDLKPFEEGLDDWDIVAPTDVGSRVQGGSAAAAAAAAATEKGLLGAITGTITSSVGKTVSSVSKAMGLKSEETAQFHLLKSPMTDAEFHKFMDAVGHLLHPEEFRMSVYQGGVETSLRTVVWRHLLNIFPDGLSGRERFEYTKRKSNEYYKLRDQWRELFSQGKGNEEIKFITNMVKKDVLRTDRTHKFYEGSDDNQNVLSLFNILVTYALTHPDISYCQGMSDLASPLLVVQKDEAAAYLCFCGLMKRIRPNFSLDGESMTVMFNHLALLLQHRDPEFYAYLKVYDAHDMLFCYRWLLLELKREFPFEDALLMLEVMWSSLPPDPPEEDLELADSSYSFSRLQCSPSPASPNLANHAYTYLRIKCLRRHASDRLKLTADVEKTENSKQDDGQKISEEKNKNIANKLNISKKELPTAITPLEEEKDLDPKEFLPVSDMATKEMMDKSSTIDRSLEGTLSSCSSGPTSIHSSQINDSDSVDEQDNLQTCRDISAEKQSKESSVNNGKTSPKKENMESVCTIDAIIKNDETAKDVKEDIGPGSPRRPTDIPLKSMFEPAVGDKQDQVNQSALIYGKDGVMTERTLELRAASQIELNSCEEVTENHPSIDFVRVNEKLPKLPAPQEFGHGNPFLIFLCLTLLVQQRDHIMRNHLDYNDLAMHFDKMVRQHNVHKVLHQAQSLYGVYLRAQANNSMADSSSPDDVSV